MASPIILSLTRKLSKDEPSPGDVKFASVAVVLRGASLKTLLIKRAEKEGDPWSGQVAFPGGKMKDGDATVRDTAIRETREEVGVDLAESARFLGYLGAFRTHTGTMDVVPSVFLLDEDVSVRLNEEVSSYRWVDFTDFANPASNSTHLVRRDGVTLQVPAFAIGEYVVWGLTYRIIRSLLENA